MRSSHQFRWDTRVYIGNSVSTACPPLPAQGSSTGRPPMDFSAHVVERLPQRLVRAGHALKLVPLPKRGAYLNFQCRVDGFRGVPISWWASLAVCYRLRAAVRSHRVPSKPDGYAPDAMFEFGPTAEWSMRECYQVMHCKCHRTDSGSSNK